MTANVESITAGQLNVGDRFMGKAPGEIVQVTSITRAFMDLFVNDTLRFSCRDTLLRVVGA